MTTSHLASDITNRCKGRLPAVGACELYTLGGITRMKVYQEVCHELREEFH